MNATEMKSLTRKAIGIQYKVRYEELISFIKDMILYNANQGNWDFTARKGAGSHDQMRQFFDDQTTRVDVVVYFQSLGYGVKINTITTSFSSWSREISGVTFSWNNPQ